jgi:hypothetical protein
MNDKLKVINNALGLNKENPILLELKKTDDENIKELHVKVVLLIQKSLGL